MRLKLRFHLITVLVLTGVLSVWMYLNFQSIYVHGADIDSDRPYYAYGWPFQKAYCSPMPISKDEYWNSIDNIVTFYERRWKFSALFGNVLFVVLLSIVIAWLIERRLIE